MWTLPTLETLDFTFYIGSTPTFLYFDLYLNTAFAQNVIDFAFYIGSTPTFIYFSLYLNTAFAQNVRLCFLYRQYTNLFYILICIWTLPTQHTTFIVLIWYETVH